MFEETTVRQNSRNISRPPMKLQDYEKILKSVAGFTWLLSKIVYYFRETDATLKTETYK